ncbi:DUF481 domain-containing protein [Vibrio ordalii]|uniref:DUF481 domain-containing protein n=1 Tax=Vibrio ordalii TaxID=28174 RepID=UPI002578160F|nr:DUF481 domain-containing protein [Vibrio ordalii]
MSKIWFLSFSLFAMSAAYANEDLKNDTEIEINSPWSAQAELGYQAHSGNSDSESLNTRLRAEYTEGRHRTSGEWKFYMLYKDGEEDKRQSTYSAQSDYKLGAKTYLYGSFKGVDSKYTAYFKDYTLSSGLGYQFINTDKLIFELEVGPGFRYQEPNLDEIDDDDIVFSDIVEEMIFRGNMRANWQALKNLSVSADVTMVSGKSNTRTDTELSLTNNITETIALKVSSSRQYHDKVPEGLNKADSIFSINLLFHF